MPSMVASETKIAIATSPPAALVTVGAAVDVEVASTSTLPLAVSEAALTYACVTVRIASSETAPAPDPPKPAVIATATQAVVIDGFELAVTTISPPSALTDEESMYAETVSPSLFWANDRPRETATTLWEKAAATI